MSVDQHPPPRILPEQPGKHPKTNRKTLQSPLVLDKRIRINVQLPLIMQNNLIKTKN